MSLARKSLDLDFTLMAKNGWLDPILTFMRGSTATRINPVTGLIETVAANVPRLEKDGLLIEGTATNYALQRSSFTAPGGDSVSWDFPAPDGTASAIRWKAITTWVLWDAQPLPVGPLTGSIWLRAVSGTMTGRLGLAHNYGEYFATNNITLTTTWQRFSVSGNSPVSGPTPNRLSFWSDQRAEFETFGAQYEVGSVATSYIPTIAEPVTRDREVCATAAISPWFNTDSGTVICDASSSLLAGNRALEIGRGNWENAIISQYSGAGANMAAVVSGQAGLTVDFGGQGRNKFAYSWSGSRIRKIAANGTFLYACDVAMPPIDTIAIGSTVDGWAQLTGYVRSLRILPHVTPDVILQKLTAL